MPGWISALDEMERQLDALEAALEAGAPVDAVIGRAPRGLGVLPDELRDRAAELQARMETLQAILALELEHTRQMLVLGGTASEGPARAVLFDRRG